MLRTGKKNDKKSFLEPFDWTFSRRTCQNLILVIPQLDLRRVWGLPGALWAALGWLLGALGWLLGALGRLLGASWESLGRSWLPPGCQMLPKRAPGSILKGSENVRGGTRRSQSYFFHTFYLQSAGHACSAIASFCAEGLLRKTICLRRCVVCPLRAWTY